MFLVIDAGNTRIKYGCHDGERWLLQCVLEDGRFRFPEGFSPRRVVMSCVAGQKVKDFLLRTVAELGASSEWLSASVERCGLQCGYDDPSSLGPDRWAAALGAWCLTGRSCVVMSAGTATTIDLIRAPGIYDGGCILPGLSMMQDALARGTAMLTFAEGEIALPARNTHDAIYTGCVLAQVGALREVSRMLSPDAPIILTGGAAPSLLSLLGPAVQYRPWLTLEGMLSVARDGARDA